MNALRISVLFFALAMATSFADETNTPPTKVTIGGVVYEDVRWGRLTPAMVTIFHRTGIATIPLEQLPQDLQKRFGYDPKKAADYRAAVAAAQAEATRQEALRKRLAEEALERQKLAQREAEAKTPSNTVTQLSFVTVSNIEQVDQGMYRAALADAGGNSVTVQFDESGKRFLEDAAAEQEQINSINEQRKQQAEAERGGNYSSSVMLNGPTSGLIVFDHRYFGGGPGLSHAGSRWVGGPRATVVESPALKYTKLNLEVFTVYAVQMDDSTFRLIGSRVTSQPGATAGISW